MLLKQYGKSSHVDEGQEGRIALVIASKHLSKPLELLKEAFNQVPFFVGIPINRPGIGNIALWWDRIESFLRINIVTDRVCAIRFITKNIAPLILIAHKKQKFLTVDFSAFYGRLVSTAFFYPFSLTSL